MSKATIDERELAEVLDVTVRTLRSRLQAGEVPRPILSSCKNRRWSRAAIERWLESRVEPAPSGE